MSIMDLDKICKKLGYKDHVFYWYVTPGKSIEDGLVKLKGHDGITRIVKELARDRKVNVLFEHFRGVNRRKAPGERSFVPIEEEKVLAKQGGVVASSEGLGEQEELKKTNPRSTVVIDTKLGLDDKNKFKRIYICFNACKQGWLHGCREIIGLDACHVKSYHNAQLMWAIGIDADNGYYPIAHAVVEKKRHESWSWFLKL
ncbi:hypothetical protein LWI29_029259 [Acer saccharum]|uniref:MULE transposase domain-containing protein n=1 Tax=Acer saccharum TaxID=4024 RepID=A0AA39RTF1_ACESA|nr:hypothetical protein LWI29_029259 [Acer saccharum]